MDFSQVGADLLIGSLEWISYLLMKVSHFLFIWEIEFVLAWGTLTLGRLNNSTQKQKFMP